jgi:hypothetical protein
MEPFSEAALAKQAALAAKEARGEKPSWTDLRGLMEPNPDLPDCQSWDVDSDVKCSLPNHHEGKHRAEVEW